MAKSVLDLYELYNLVIARGGLVDVINKKLWQEIIKGLHLPSSITSAAFTLRTQYMKYLYPYECEKKNLSSPAELQAAIDGNRREGRRSSYGQFEAMHNQMQLPQLGRNNLTGTMQQMSPLALVTHGNPQAAAAAAAAAAHHRLMAPSFSQVPNLVQHEFEQRMVEYLKMIQAKKEQTRPRSQSPEITTREALNALEMSRVALWSMYHNNTSPPASVNTSPQGIEPQREALNLSDSPPNVVIKREREPSEVGTNSDREDFNQPPAKRGFPSNLYVPPIRRSFHDANDGQQVGSSAITNASHEQGGSQRDMAVKSPKSPGERNSRERNNSPMLVSPPKNENSSFSSNESVSTSHLSGHQAVKSSSLGVTNAELSLLSGMQFKLSRKSTGANGDQQLVVNLELNGVNYEGVLIAMPQAKSLASTSTIVSPQPKLVTNGQVEIQQPMCLEQLPAAQY